MAGVVEVHDADGEVAVTEQVDEDNATDNSCCFFPPANEGGPWVHKAVVMRNVFSPSQLSNDRTKLYAGMGRFSSRPGTSSAMLNAEPGAGVDEYMVLIGDTIAAVMRSGPNNCLAVCLGQFRRFPSRSGTPAGAGEDNTPPELWPALEIMFKYKFITTSAGVLVGLGLVYVPLGVSIRRSEAAIWRVEGHVTTLKNDVKTLEVDTAKPSDHMTMSWCKTPWIGRGYLEQHFEPLPKQFG